MTIKRIKELYEQMEISSQPTIGEIRNAIMIITRFEWRIDKHPLEGAVFDIYTDFAEDDYNEYTLQIHCPIKTEKVFRMVIMIQVKNLKTGFQKVYDKVELSKPRVMI